MLSNSLEQNVFLNNNIYTESTTVNLFNEMSFDNFEEDKTYPNKPTKRPPFGEMSSHFQPRSEQPKMHEPGT